MASLDFSQGGVSASLDDYQKILANRQASWNQKQTQGIADAFSQALVTAPIAGSNLRPGDLDEGKFYSLVKEKGLSPELAGGYRNWWLANKKAQTEGAQQNVGQRMVGFSPDEPKPSNEIQQQDRFLNPQPGDTAQGQASASPLQASSPTDLFSRMAGRANPLRTQQAAPAKPTVEQSAAPTTQAAPAAQGGQGMDLGSANLATFKLPPPAEEPPKPADSYGVIQGFMATDRGFNPMAMLQAGGFTPRTADDVSRMSKQDRDETVAGLRAKGVSLPSNPSADDVARGVNMYAGAQVRAKMGGFNPFDLGETMKAATGMATGGEAIANEATGELAKGARETKTTRLGQTSAAQGIQSTGQELAAVDDARRQGFGNVTRSNLPNFKEAKTNFDWLNGTKGDTDALLQQVRAGKPLDPDQFGNLLNGLTQSAKAVEGVNTEAAQANFMATMRRQKSIGQVVQEAHGFGDLAALAGKNAIAPQEQAIILKNLSDLLGLQLKSGKAANQLNQYRTIKQQADRAIGESVGVGRNLPTFASPADPGFSALPAGAWFLDGRGQRRQKH